MTASNNSPRKWQRIAAAGLWLAAAGGPASTDLWADGLPKLMAQRSAEARPALRGRRPAASLEEQDAAPSRGSSRGRIQPVSASSEPATIREHAHAPPPVRDEFLKPDDAQAITLIDLPSALQLAGVQNPQIMIAYERVLAATAVQQLAAAQALPNLNAGTNYDGHTGVYQQASGNILNVNRNSLYVGAGANAVGGGSVNIPGIQYNLNLSQTIYSYLISQQSTEQSRYASQAVQNELQLRVAVAYNDLLQAEGLRAIAFQARDDAADLARVTAVFAKTGQGRQADADRAATELARREADLLTADGNVTTASARLSQLLYLESSTRLHPADNWVVPRSVVPEAIPLPELLVTALYRRPELGERRAAVHAAMMGLTAAKVLPFSPQIIAGYSAGVFGGGSDLVAGSRNPRFGAPLNEPRFGSFAPRADVDAVAYWSLQNLGVGNKAMIDAARARLSAADLEQLVVLNQVRAEVADAYGRVQTRRAELETRRQAVVSSQEAFQEDVVRTRQNVGRPIEVLDSLRLLARARTDYLNSIVEYNNAHFGLYTAIGQPPADLLVRPAEERDGSQ